MNSKKTYGDCINCPLYQNKIVIGESNTKNLENIDLLVLAEAPSHSEIEENRPLSPNGKAGSIFRKCFEDSGLITTKHYISNVVLCSNIKSGKTFNPPKEAYEKCKPNWEKMIEKFNPKYILLLGNSVKDMFNIIGSMHDCRGKIFYKYNRPVYVTYHPSFIQRNGGISENNIKYSEFLNDFKSLKEMIDNHNDINHNRELLTLTEDFDILKNDKNDNCFYYNIPDKFYDENIKLFDIQYIKQTKQILYIFKDKEKDMLWTTDGRKRYFYRSKINKNKAPYILPVSQTNVCFGYADTNDDSSLYESDLRVQLKHSIDYAIKRKPIKSDIEPSKMYCDIEVYTGNHKGFPTPKESAFMINAISMKEKNKAIKVLIAKHPDMDKNIPKSVLNIDFEILENEEKLIKRFIDILNIRNPNILSFWNGDNFDIPYLINRMKKINIDPSKLSPVNHIFFDPTDYDKTEIYGRYIIDQLILYKKMVQAKEESYKLSYITQKYLGHTKVAYEGTLNELYRTDISKFIEYSGVDAELLWELEEKLNHIKTREELINICSSTWKAGEKTMGLIEPLTIKYLKEHNYVCKDKTTYEEDIDFAGAYVLKSKPGLYKWVIDLDFTSLYPSIIRTFNIGPDTYILKIVDEINNNIFNMTAYNIIYNRDKLPNIIKVIKNPLVNSIVTEVNKDDFLNWLDTNKNIITVNGTVFLGNRESFFSKIVKYLMEQRTFYKKEMINNMKNEEVASKLNCIQNAYKILANSLFGGFGNKYFRLFNIDIAQSITLSGREITRFTSYHCSKLLKNNDKSIEKNFHLIYDDVDIPYIIYGDTDSLFVDIGSYIQKKNEE